MVQHFGALIFPFSAILGGISAFATSASCVQQPHTNRCLGSEWSALSRTDSLPLLVNEVFLLVRSVAETRQSPSAFNISPFWTLFIGKASHYFLFCVALFIKALDSAKRLQKVIMIAIIKVFSFKKDPHF